jgi:hypothetical protein
MPLLYGKVFKGGRVLLVMKKLQTSRIRDSPENRAMQEEIRARANYSLAVLGMSFVYHGSGRFLNLRPPTDYDVVEARRTA